MSDTVGELNVCSDASDSSWEDAEDEETVTGVNAGGYPNPLLMNSLILEKILQFLPVNELQKCRLVCKEWNKTALLRRVIGSKARTRIIMDESFDGFLRVAQNSLQPFCRKFDFQHIQLDVNRVLKFVKIFGERISHLSIRNCTASSKQSVIELLNCPRLEELIVHGELPEVDEENFHRFLFTRLKVLSINSSFMDSQVSKDFIKMVLKRSPNLEKIRTGYNISVWENFCSVLTATDSPKLCKVELCVVRAPLQKDCFQSFLAKKLIPREIFLHGCLVSQDFFEQLLLQTYQNLLVLHIEGTQQEILTKAFSSITLPNIKELSLPIDGIGSSEGSYILRSCPKLKVLKVTGLFQTVFKFQDGSLMSICMQDDAFSSTLRSNSNTIVREKQREFLKAVSLINLQPKKLIINLPDINSRCLRAIYARFSNLEDISLGLNSVRECIVGLTGIPHRIYRRIAHCKSFSVISISTNKLNLLPSISKLQCLKRLELSFIGDIPSAELTLILLAYGICGIGSLRELVLNNFTISDVSFTTLAQKLNLSVCKTNGSTKQWGRFQSCYKQCAIKSFLLPPAQIGPQNSSPAHLMGMNSQFLTKVINCLGFTDAFEARKVCSNWHTLLSEYLHRGCEGQSLAGALEKRLFQYLEDQTYPGPVVGYLSYFARKKVQNLPIVLRLWGSIRRETTLAIVRVKKSTLEDCQMNYGQHNTLKRNGTCRRRDILEYWYYPDGCDDLVHHPTLRQEVLTDLDQSSCNLTTLLAIGCWEPKDDRLLEFFNPSWTLSTIHLIGLQKNLLDIVLPKLTQMINLESLRIKSIVRDINYFDFDLTKTHLQILCNAAFSLKSLTMQLHAPPESVAAFVKSQRFTLEVLKLHCLVHTSDRFTFSIPHLRILQLDEPPGCLLWRTLAVHSTLKTISFGQSGTICNEVKNKPSPKMDLFDSDFKHSATEMSCDVNWFLDNSICRNETRVQKSMLQGGSDSALKFLTHFPHLSSLTLRGVHAHYGILQGIFRKCPQLKKLELINATGVTDEILTGFSKEILDEIDIMNPFQVRRDRHTMEVKGKGVSSIRKLKRLTHLALDDQPSCTDFAVLFGLLNLSQLQYLSCKNWKISDISIRALADILPSLKEINTNDCPNVSNYALEYFKESRFQRK